MRAVIQRVNHASVTVGDEVVGRIERGLLLLLGITHDDDESSAIALRDKVLKLRLFTAEDGSSGFDRSVVEVGGELLLVSQFTLYASTKKGRRPSFTDAARPEQAEPLFNRTLELFAESGLKVASGRFGAMMRVQLENDGPVTIVLDGG